MVRLLEDPVGNIGLFGGTFDPPHLGHLRAAADAAAELKLDQLVLIPSPQPPHKRNRTFTDYHHRRAMVELCLPTDDRFRLSLVEEEGLPGTTYETIQKLRHLGFTEDHCHLVWLMGSDSLLDLNHWHKPEDLLNTIEVAVMPRPGYSVSQANKEHLARVKVLNTPLFDLSASEIREKQQSLEDWVAPPVAAYIRMHKLYGF
ncbi:nicotinate (nicotinamide) nucleotide adenylyltransferase [bacterium]|nr:nicotinate (nicotinamide) nucleotide adenylyltransferase [bacterium]MBU1653014.1 nicotinate (nicotinamide) nucleotide adenylyltransferase [bacterium]MBU1881331.1 nicotinate (nicotinamide) nucleotide adenylyltransferase [bacterium]